ncbi:class I SAM-dependent methyltransferase [Parasphingorhabdus pacifica]
MGSSTERAAKLRTFWDDAASSYDRQMRLFERFFAGDSRNWVCSQASGDVLEVAIGTGLNVPAYPSDVRVTGIEWSGRMLELARLRAAELSVPVDLLEADAQALPFPEAVFDTVVCTFSLCAIPDERKAVAEMRRVLRPGGRLLLADHVASSWLPVRLLQRAVEVVSVPVGGEHFLRRPLERARALGFVVENVERFKLGVVERLVARKPPASSA